MSSLNSMQQFHTRQKANDGAQMPISLPDGTPTEHWLQVRGVDSDPFRRAEAESRRKAMDIAQEKDADRRAQMIEDAKLDVLAVLVAAWSFGEPCTVENVRAFLKESPQIADQMDRFAYNRARFFGASLKTSTPTPAQASS